MRVQTPTADQEKFLQAARALALTKMPYMAATLFAFRAVSAPGLGTYACDAQMRLYIDFEAAMANGVEHGAQALLHECMHIFRQDHLLAGELGADPSADGKLLNVAADAANNDDLRDGGCTMFANDNPYGHITPSRLGQPDNLTAHAYFRALDAKRPPQPQPQPQDGQPQDGQGDGDSQPGAGQQPGQGQPGQGQQAGKPYGGCGSAAGNAWDGELAPDDSMGGDAPAASGAEVERIRISTAAAIRDQAAKGIGSMPGGILETAEFVLAPPKVAWQQVLGRLIRGALRSRAGLGEDTYSRRNARRHDARVRTASNTLGSRIVMPGQVRPIPRITVIRDTSGSMAGSDIAAITNEVVGIAKRVGVTGDDLRVVDFDTQSYGAVKFNRASDLAEVKGRGGTSMDAAVLEALAAKPAPSAVVVMTDGGTAWPEQPRTRIPVIAAIVGTESAVGHTIGRVPSWIRAVRVEL